MQSHNQEIVRIQAYAERTVDFVVEVINGVRMLVHKMATSDSAMLNNLNRYNSELKNEFSRRGNIIRIKEKVWKEYEKKRDTLWKEYGFTLSYHSIRTFSLYFGYRNSGIFETDKFSNLDLMLDSTRLASELNGHYGLGTFSGTSNVLSIKKDKFEDFKTIVDNKKIIITENPGNFNLPSELKIDTKISNEIKEAAKKRKKTKESPKPTHSNLSNPNGTPQSILQNTFQGNFHVQGTSYLFNPFDINKIKDIPRFDPNLVLDAEVLYQSNTSVTNDSINSNPITTAEEKTPNTGKKRAAQNNDSGSDLSTEEDSSSDDEITSRQNSSAFKKANPTLFSNFNKTAPKVYASISTQKSNNRT